MFTMKRIFQLVLLVSAAFPIQVAAQQMRMFSADQAFILPESGTVIVLRDGALVVDMPHRPDATAFDIKQGDIVAMAQRKKVAGIEELRQLYKQTAHGEAFKMGLRRDGTLIVVSVTRDTAVSAGGQRMVFSGPPGAAPAGRERRVMMMGDGNSMFVHQESGIVFRLDGNAVKIGAVVEQMNPAGKNAGFEQNDVVLTANGAKISSLDDVKNALATRQSGHEFEVKRGEKTYTFKLK